MFDKPQAASTIGLEIDGTLLKSAQLSFVKGKPSLDSTFAITLDPAATENVNLLDMTEDGQKFRKSVQKNLIVTCLKSDEVLIRNLDIKLKKDRDIDSVLSFQAEPLLPYPVENAILDRSTIAQNADGTQITLYAARKDHVKQHVEQWDALDIIPDVISCVPVALAFFSKLVTKTVQPHVVLNIDKTQTTAALVKEGKLLAAQSSSTGLDALTQLIPLGTPALHFDKITSEDFPDLYNVIEEWRRDISRLLYALSKQVRDIEVTELLLTGEGTEYMNLGETLCKDAHKHFLRIDNIPNFDIPSPMMQRFAVPIGAALSALENTTDQVNFRQQDFSHPHPWKQLKKPLAIYGILCAALATAFYFFGQAHIHNKENLVRQDYISLLTTMNKSYPAFEKEFAAKNPSLTKYEENEAVPKLDSLTPSMIEQRLQFLQKDLKDTPDTFPLFPNTPRVSDLLAWLSSHPIVTGQNKDDPKAALSPLQIDTLSYTLVKRPELKKKQEKYQVKVEVEFNTPTPKLAREFHDALIAPNEMVDPKGEVKWTTNKGKYRASFFLKDKTSYPSTAPAGG